MTQIALDYDLVPETLFLCLNIFDRVLSKLKINSKKYMLLAVTSMFISSKYEEIYPPDLTEIVKVSPFSYSPEEVKDYEIFILQKLDYELLTVSPYIFLVRDHSVIDPKNKELFHMAHFILEFSLLNKSFCKYMNSLKAAGALYTAVKILNLKQKGDPFWNRHFHLFTDYYERDLIPVYQCISSYISAEGENLKTLPVYEKFLLRSYGNVSPKVLDYFLKQKELEEKKKEEKKKKDEKKKKREEKTK